MDSRGTFLGIIQASKERERTNLRDVPPSVAQYLAYINEYSNSTRLSDPAVLQALTDDVAIRLVQIT